MIANHTTMPSRMELRVNLRIPSPPGRRTCAAVRWIRVLANAVGYISGILLKAMEQGELEERVAKLEADLTGNASAETRTPGLALQLDSGSTRVELPSDFCFDAE